MLTLSYGYKLPQSGDKGATLWQALEDNITRLNGHTHDGVNSSKLLVQNFQSTKQTILAANWVLSVTNPGHYSQTVTIPAGFTYDDFVIDFRDASNRKIYPGVTKLSNTTFTIFTIDNTQAFTAVYGV